MTAKSKAKEFTDQCAQGDVVTRRIDSLPKDATLVVNKTQRHIVTHSETGHHHTITAPPSSVQMFGSSNPLMGYMKVMKRSVELRHERAWDTHEPIKITPGVYEIRRQREWSPEGWRRVED